MRSARLRHLLALILVMCYGARAGAWQLPLDYLSRFGSTEVVLSTQEGFGVRFIPLPLDLDLRLSLVKAPTYLDYGLSARKDYGEIRLGVFYSQPQFRVSYLPPSGLQYVGSIKPDYGDFSGGYAWQFLDKKVRVKPMLGVVIDGPRTLPYTLLNVSANESFQGDGYSFSVGAGAEVLAFLNSGNVQQAYSASAFGTYKLTPQVSLFGYHIGQFVNGKADAERLQAYPYQISYLSAAYRMPSTGFPVGLGGLRVSANRSWLNDVTTVTGDVLFRIDGLPALLGPSVGYRWNPDGTRTWIFSLASM